MKLTLMRDNGGTPTMRTLDINLQIEAMKHETKATDKHTLRITGRQAGRRQEIDKSHPGCSFSQNGQRHTDDRIQRNHTNRSQSSGKLDGSEPGEAGSGRAFADLSCFHGFQRTFRKNMGTVHTTGQITSQKPGRSGNLSSACL